MRTIISHANDERTPGRERVNNYNFFNMLSMSKSLFGSLLKLFAITSSLTGGKYARRKKSACFLFVTRAFVLIGISTTTKVSLVFFLPPRSLFWNWPKNVFIESRCLVFGLGNDRSYYFSCSIHFEVQEPIFTKVWTCFILLKMTEHKVTIITVWSVYKQAWPESVERPGTVTLG